MTTDTDKPSDKLVEMARAAGFRVGRYSTGQRYIQSIDGAADVTKELAAFASAYIASLCGDMEPVPGAVVRGEVVYSAITVAALLARVAELETAVLEGARRVESLKRECSDPESPIATQNARYMSMSYFLRAALTKGRP